MDTELRVGELARRSGLSVRALHHYDEIGLLRPSRRTGSGHRLYALRDVERLLRIRALQMLGFSLEQVRLCLDDRAFAPVAVLERQIEVLRAEQERGARLLARLHELRDRLAGSGEVSVGEFLDTLEEMTMFEKYYTPEQMAQLQARARELGEERIRAAEAEWPQLIAQVRAEMAAGTDPGDPKVRAMAERWRELIEEFTGGDAGIRESLRNLYANEARVREHHGLDGDLMRYVEKAMGDT